MKLPRLMIPAALLALPAQAQAPDLVDSYSQVAAQLVQAAASSDTAYERLRVLCDRFGARISGSPQLEAAIDWAAQEMQADGLVVSSHPVTVPHWQRGEERVTLLSPMNKELAMIGLGMTVPTPAEGIEAEVVAVSSWAELEQLGQEGVKGRIVLFDVPFTTYGETAGFRGAGPVEAAKLGAVGVLIRSVTPESLNTPHTGATRVPDDQATVPAAALSLEHAAWLHRMVDAGESVRVRMLLQSERGEATSRNLLAELPGSELPEEVVVLGCHIDSWDVGQGAQDDGAGCMIVWEALRLIQEQGLTPRRTLRAVWFTNEENGLRGARTYARVEADTRHVAAFESDTGNGRASGFRVDLRLPEQAKGRQLQAQGRIWELSNLFAPLGGADWSAGYSGADIGPLAAAGVPALGMRHDTTAYWPIHHTEADTFDRIIPEDLQHNVGLMAAAAYVLADMPEPLLPQDRPRRRGRRR